MEEVQLKEQPKDAAFMPGMLIGLTGKKQSGKDTVAEHLIEEYGFTRYAFADPIKEACQAIFGFTKEQCWGKEKELIDPFWHISPRKALQIIGTELFQFELPKYAPELAEIGRTFWVQRFALWYEKFLEKYPDGGVVISDVRFPFEADMIKSLGGTIIKIVRPSEQYNDMHSSETEMDQIQYDYLLNNTRTIEDLKIAVDEVYHHIFL